MSPFWLTGRRFGGSAGLCLLFAAGCTGEQLEGRWRGPFPLDGASACVLNLYSNRTFDLACDQMTWVGAGHYRYGDDRVKLEFTILHRRQLPVRRPPKINLRLTPHGNWIDLIDDAGRRYSLNRGT